ncbi:MAG: exonuclease domain-containing protein [Anaerolineae bacterium]|nr:exonuclease domain-containing protein [Anaerolineae bacterium]
MANRLDEILVVDVEATCWDGEVPHGQEREIIEIGVCALRVETGHRRRVESILVRPECSTVSAFCTGLTTLTQAQVAGGVTFKDACLLLRKKYSSRSRAWASWGNYDRRQFEQQCEARGVKYPFNSTHLNVKNLFALAYGLSQEVGIDRALEMLGLPFEGTQHRGADDAWNIARVLSILLLRSRDGSG